jgi:hypothetical protein
VSVARRSTASIRCGSGPKPNAADCRRSGSDGPPSGFDGLRLGDNVPNGVRKAVDTLRGPDHRVRRGHTAIIRENPALFAPSEPSDPAPSRSVKFRQASCLKGLEGKNYTRVRPSLPNRVIFTRFDLSQSPVHFPSHPFNRLHR